MKKLFLLLLVFFAILGLNNAPVYSQGFIPSEITIDEKADVVVLADLNLNDAVELVIIDRIDASNSRISIYDGLPVPTRLNEISIPGLDNPKLSTADFNNDGRLELVVSGMSEGKPFLDILEGDVDFNYMSLFSSVPQLNLPFKILDFNHDGKLDLLGSLFSDNDDSLRVYLNKGESLTACQNCLSGIIGSPELLIDIANDGFLDLLISNGTGLHFYENLGKADSINYNVFPEFTDDLLIDFGDMNQDGVDELVIAGLINQSFSFSIMKLDTAGLITQKTQQIFGEPIKMRIADFTNDGDLDILLQEGDSLILYQMNFLDITIRHSISGDLDSVIFDIIDLDRDLDLDIVVSGAKQPDYKLQLITNDNISNIAPVNPDHLELFAISMGDSVQFLWGNGADNTTPNQSLTYELFVIGLDGNSQLPWYSGRNRSITDNGRQLHSQQYLLKDLPNGTYQWAVQSIDNSLVGPQCFGSGGSDVCGAQFVVDTGREKSHDVCKGDTLERYLQPPIITSWYSLNRGFLQESDTLIYIVEDNDWIYTNYIEDGCTSMTHSEEINVYKSVELPFENFDGCYGDMISYTIEEEIDSASWIFLQSGETYTGLSINIHATISDILLLTVIGTKGCITKDTIEINVYENVDFQFENFDGCIGDTISYTIEEEIESATWEFMKSGETRSGPSISTPATMSDILLLTVIGAQECLLTDTIMINVSSPPDIDAGEDLEVVSGDSIQLQASGGTTYTWSPATDLNDSELANPIASPEVTTTYTVTGSNEAGCSATDDVVVSVVDVNNDVSDDDVIDDVQQMAFVPNLFSPNDDGNNDVLTVYGDNIANAEFKVFDSLGQLVFSTQINSGSNQDWDGTFNGNPLPAGTYVWSLTGTYTDGSSIAQVGPASGTVTLIR